MTAPPIHPGWARDETPPFRDDDFVARYFGVASAQLRLIALLDILPDGTGRLDLGLPVDPAGPASAYVSPEVRLSPAALAAALVGGPAALTATHAPLAREALRRQLLLRRVTLGVTAS